MYPIVVDHFFLDLRKHLVPCSGSKHNAIVPRGRRIAYMWKKGGKEEVAGNLDIVLRHLNRGFGMHWNRIQQFLKQPSLDRRCRGTQHTTNVLSCALQVHRARELKGRLPVSKGTPRGKKIGL